MPAIGLCLSWCTRGKDARGPCQVVVWGALGSLGGDGGGGWVGHSGRVVAAALCWIDRLSCHQPVWLVWLHTDGSSVEM